MAIGRTVFILENIVYARPLSRFIQATTSVYYFTDDLFILFDYLECVELVINTSDFQKKMILLVYRYH